MGWPPGPPVLLDLQEQKQCMHGQGHTGSGRPVVMGHRDATLKRKDEEELTWSWEPLVCRRASGSFWKQQQVSGNGAAHPAGSRRTWVQAFRQDVVDLDGALTFPAPKLPSLQDTILSPAL